MEGMKEEQRNATQRDVHGHNEIRITKKRYLSPKPSKSISHTRGARNTSNDAAAQQKDVIQFLAPIHDWVDTIIDLEPPNDDTENSMRPNHIMKSAYIIYARWREGREGESVPLFTVNTSCCPAIMGSFITRYSLRNRLKPAGRIQLIKSGSSTSGNVTPVDVTLYCVALHCIACDHSLMMKS